MAEDRREEISTFLEEARIAILYKNFEQAKGLIDKVLKNDPNNTEAHYLLGFIYEMTNKIEEAKKEYRRALELSPDNKEAAERLSRLITMS